MKSLIIIHNYSLKNNIEYQIINSSNIIVTIKIRKNKYYV